MLNSSWKVQTAWQRGSGQTGNNSEKGVRTRINTQEIVQFYKGHEERKTQKEKKSQIFCMLTLLARVAQWLPRSLHKKTASSCINGTVMKPTMLTQTFVLSFDVSLPISHKTASLCSFCPWSVWAENAITSP